jgi:hypothetical protein
MSESGGRWVVRRLDDKMLKAFVRWYCQGESVL